MNDFSDRIAKLSPKRLAFLALELQEQVDALRRAQTEPIAVVGIGCRFPGEATDPDAFWDLLRRGRDAIAEVPADRWDAEAFYDPDPDAPGKMYTKRGAFLREVDRFDPQFFGISPREAVGLDPQQRLLLEVTWETLEAAGQVPEKLLGSKTGVFVGISSGDYMRMQWSPEAFDIYSGTGNALSVAAGRLAYTLGLQGPCLAVDTACSSSLVAVHLACQSLRNGECSLALAGGVNVILTPDANVMLSRGRMLAPDGRCKTFDAAADGYVRGEGCGMVALKRLGDAVAAGDRILALLRGSATNQDGRSSGLTAPNGPAQEAVVREAMARAGVAAHEIGYVEAHGTGTSLGDPIEVHALGAVLSPGRAAADPVLIGSVKTNIGHLEAAAGVAGLIKVILALQQGELPPHIGLRTPNPHIAWDSLPVRVVTETTPWARGPRRRLAGVSSFGFSGSNAHVIVEEAPAPASEPASGGPDRPQHLLAISARTSTSLRNQVDLYAARLARVSSARDLADLCFSASTGRSHFEHRLAAAGASADELGAGLAAFAAEGSAPRVQSGRIDPAATADVAFLFAGQGSQYHGMARELYETQPVFRAALDRAAGALREEMAEPLLDVLYQPGGAALLDQTQYTQPALFAVEYALAELWRSWGVRPVAMLGHSVGEYVAACVAGVFPVEDGVRLVAARARLMQALPPGGAMAALFLSRAQAEAALAGHPGLSIAAVNGPSEVVVSGDRAACDALRARLEREGIRSEPLRVSHAFHSALIEPMLDEFERVAGRIKYELPQVDVISNLTGAPARGDEIASAAYWRRHARAAVLFAPGLESLRALGVTRFLEIGPGATLSGLGRRTLGDEGCTWLPSLRKGRSDWQQLLDTLGGLYVKGVRIDWDAFDRGFGRRAVALPTYPFRRERYWVDADAGTPQERAAASTTAAHPLLGRQLLSPALPDGDTVFEADLRSRATAYLSDHKVAGAVLAPAAAFVELALAAFDRMARPDRPPSVADLVIESALVLRDGVDQRVQVIVEHGDAPAFRILSAAAEDEGAPPRWTTHATGRIRAAGSGAVPETIDPGVVKARGAAMAGDDYYQKLQAGGVDMGPRFRAITGLWRRDGEALGEIRLPEALARDAGRYAVHPVLFDACCHVAGASLPNPSGESYLVVGVRRFERLDRLDAEITAHAVVCPRAGEGGTIDVDVTVCDRAGRPVARLEGISFRRAAIARAPSPASDWLYRVEWQVKPRPDQPGGALAAPRALAASLAAEASAVLADPEIAAMPETLPPLEGLATAHAVRALAQLGWRPAAGDRVTAAGLAEALRVVPQQRRLLGRLLEFLEEDGLLRRTGAELEVVRVPEGRDLPALDAPRTSSADATLTLVQRCGTALGAVLRGEADPLQLLFPSGSFDVLAKIYGESTAARSFSALVARVVASAVGGAGTRPVRVLEIGAGTGSTTSALLPALDAGRTDYLFTDVSGLFLARARERFQASPNIDFRVLDIEQDPAAQGLPPGRFDVIVAANVIHATRDLRQTLAHVRQLAAPGALFVMVEAARPARWVDITFGLTDGWWRFADRDLRPSHPLLSRRAWLDLLAASGFVDPFALPGDLADDDPRAAQFVFAAGVPEAAVDAAVPARRQRRWLVVGDRGGVGDALSARLAAAGDEPLLLTATESGNSLRERVRDWASAGAPIHGAVILSALDAAPPARTTARGLVADQLAGCGAALDVLQALADGPAVPIWIATAHAQPVARDPSGEDLSPAQAAVWGLGRVIGLEHPAFWGGLVDLDPGDPDAAAALLAREIGDPDGEDQIAWRGSARHVARLVRAPELAGHGTRLRGDASYLVTGGIGGLGLKVAAWLAEQGARHLVLTGRRGLPPRAEWASLRSDTEAGRQTAAIEAIERSGAAVHVAAVDVADEAAMAALMADFGSRRPPLRGVIHAAAALSSSSLRDLTADHLRAMLRPKTAGTWILHEQTAALDLDFFVSFSSTTSLLGSKQLGHYAAANTFLDAFAHYRRRAGLPATTINWGTWDLMKVTADQEREIRQGGLKPMASARALAALGQLLACAEPQATVAHVDWETLKAVYEARRQRPFLEQVASRGARRPSSGEAGAAILQRLSSLKPEDRRDALLAHVRTIAAAVLGLPLADVDEDRGLFDMGMDSLMSVELKGRLERSIGRALPSSLTFNCPTVEALTGYLAGELGDLVPVAAATAAAPAGSAASEPAADDFDDLSEDELTSLLAEKLGQTT